MPFRLKVNYFDRHAEHVDPSVPLCNHQTHWLLLSDVFRGKIFYSLPANMIASGLVKGEAEVEIIYRARGEIDVIINHSDYLGAKEKRDVQELLEEARARISELEARGS